MDGRGKLALAVIAFGAAWNLFGLIKAHAAEAPCNGLCRTWMGENRQDQSEAAPPPSAGTAVTEGSPDGTAAADSAEAAPKKVAPKPNAGRKVQKRKAAAANPADPALDAEGVQQKAGPVRKRVSDLPPSKTSPGAVKPTAAVADGVIKSPTPVPRGKTAPLASGLPKGGKPVAAESAGVRPSQGRAVPPRKPGVPGNGAPATVVSLPRPAPIVPPPVHLNKPEPSVGLNTARTPAVPLHVSAEEVHPSSVDPVVPAAAPIGQAAPTPAPRMDPVKLSIAPQPRSAWTAESPADPPKSPGGVPDAKQAEEQGRSRETDYLIGKPPTGRPEEKGGVDATAVNAHAPPTATITLDDLKATIRQSAQDVLQHSALYGF